MPENPAHEELQRLKSEITVVRNILHKEKELFVAVFDGCRDAIFLSDPNASIVLVNHAATELTGYSKKELLQMSISDLPAPEDRRMFHHYFQGKIKGEPLLFETDIQRKNKEKIPVEFSNRGVAIDGKTYIHTVARDISQRKLAEAELSQSSETNRRLYGMIRRMCDNVPDMIWAKDLEKKYIFANKAICEKLLNAADTSEPVGRTDMFFAERERAAHPEDPDWHTFGESCRDSDTVVMASGVPETFDEYGNCKGKFLYLSVHKAPFFNEQGEMIGTVGSARDITERKKAEEALRNSNYKFEAVLNTLDAVVYIADMDSYEILFMNAHMKKEFGEDFTGRTCWQSLQEDQTAPCEFCTNDRLVDEDGNPVEPYIWESYNQKMNKWYECHDQAIPWTGGHLVRMEIAVDITERKKMRDHLEELVEERTAELEDTNTALKVLLNKREKDQEELEDKILANYHSLIEPLLHQLKTNTANNKQQNLLEILESNLAEIVSPFSQKLTDPMIQLTPKELQIASFIKEDYSNKEIAESFNCSVRTIDAHRNGIRKKLDIKNKKVNLKTYLMSL